MFSVNSELECRGKECGISLSQNEFFGVWGEHIQFFTEAGEGRENFFKIFKTKWQNSIYAPPPQLGFMIRVSKQSDQ